MKELKIIVVGLAIIAIVAAPVYIVGALNLNALDYKKPCPISGARCTDSSDALLRGCHG